MPTRQGIETRAFHEVRATSRDTRTLRGYAAVFDEWADIAGLFAERFMRGAFRDSVESGDVVALVNHDHSRLLGRTKNSTLRLEEDDRGLAIEVDLPDTTEGRDLYALVERGDIDKMSVGFIVVRDEWDLEPIIARRTILQADLIDVSAVTFPAYEGTDIAVRARDTALESQRAVTKARLARKLRVLELGERRR